MDSQVRNANRVLSSKLPERFGWEGKGPEPDWFQKWVRKKWLYIRNIARMKGKIPDMIKYWKMDKIKEIYPDCDPDKQKHLTDKISEEKYINEGVEFRCECGHLVHPGDFYFIINDELYCKYCKNRNRR